MKRHAAADVVFGKLGVADSNAFFSRGQQDGLFIGISPFVAGQAVSPSFRLWQRPVRRNLLGRARIGFIKWHTPPSPIRLLFTGLSTGFFNILFHDLRVGVITATTETSF